ncbi:MAG TPA: DUF1697 domain-containing protein [Rhodothermia bacterium]|nr:DUF1697 domain-containing protein [Rhodothermia bacterium]
MALVVFLRGLNVGGHRRFRPSTLAARLQHVGAINVGATGTFVIRKPVGRRELRGEISEAIPFPVEVAICDGRDVTALVSRDRFSEHQTGADTVRFVSVLSRAPRLTPELPFTFPDQGPWLVKVLAREGRFVVGLYRRDMKVIGLLGELDRVFGVRATTRSWGTMETIAKVLDGKTG